MNEIAAVRSILVKFVTLCPEDTTNERLVGAETPVSDIHFVFGEDPQSDSWNSLDICFRHLAKIELVEDIKNRYGVSSMGEIRRRRRFLRHGRTQGSSLMRRMRHLLFDRKASSLPGFNAPFQVGDIPARIPLLQ